MSFRFKQFLIEQDHCAMKVTTDGCLFGAWCAEKIKAQLPVKTDDKENTALDIGTGTGLLSLMIAQKIAQLQIDAIEIDREATAQANQNVLASPWDEKVHVFYGDAKNFRYPSKYNVIVSNPPFYENELKSPKEKKNVAHHSDELGLTDLFRLTHQQLDAGGKFYFLFPFKRREEIESLLSDHGLFIQEIVLVRQSTQHDYFRMMIAGGLEEQKITATEIAIKNDKDEYSSSFVELLKDYYLYL